MHQLQYHNVSFTYDGLADPLLSGLDLSIAPGWTGVVGPNGAGKSTFLLLATDALAVHRSSTRSGRLKTPRAAESFPR